MRLDRVVSVLVVDVSMNLFRLMTFVCILIPPLVVRLLFRNGNNKKRRYLENPFSSLKGKINHTLYP